MCSRLHGSSTSSAKNTSKHLFIISASIVLLTSPPNIRKAKTAFKSVEEQLEYLEDNVVLDECHADVLIELKRYNEAADVHIKEGRTTEAIEVLVLDTGSQDSSRRANGYILQGLWQNISFAMKIEDSNAAALQLLSLACKINSDMLSPTQKDEVCLVIA